MKTVATLVSVLLYALPALAQDAPKTTVTQADCKRIVKHTPRADVAYQSGVDVRGNAVVGADLKRPEGAFKIPDQITIDFGLDFAGRYGFDGTGTQDATASLFLITYDLAMGALTVNGQPLNKADSAAVAKSCAAMLKGQ